MRRRECLAVPIAFAASLPATAAQALPAPCTEHPGLGRGFHLGEVIGRTLADYREMAALGASLVRFGIALEVDGSGYKTPTRAVQELLSQAGFAAATGMRIVVVLRPAPEPDAPLWARPELEASLEAIWRGLARQLAGRKEIAAFDLVNEPHPPGWTFRGKQSRSSALALRLARAVRAEDPQRTLVVEPSPGARPMGFETMDPLPLTNVVYSVHMYEPFEVTHQRVGDPRLDAVIAYPGPVTAGGPPWDDRRLRDTLAPVKQFADRHGAEIYVGEFGIARWAPGSSRERYLADLTAIFAEWRWSWTYHAWREWQGWDAEMDGAMAHVGRRPDQPALEVLRAALRACTPRAAGSR